VTDTDVTVKIPIERVGAFYRLLGSWLDDPNLVLVPKGTLNWPTGDPWGDHPDQDETIARQIFTAAPVAVKELVRTLLDSPGTPVDEPDIATRCGVHGDGAITQLLVSLAVACSDHHRTNPIKWIVTNDHTQYWLPSSAKHTWTAALKPPNA
jgi:hypothetical protein